MSLAEPTITPCATGRRTPKDQIKARESVIVSPVAFSTSARGISHQSLLTRRQIETEAEIMSVGLTNPDRRGGQSDFRLYDSTDANYATSELGKFCRLHHNADGNYRTSTAFLRYRAGMQFAMVIDNDLVSNGLGPRSRGDAGVAGEPTDDDLAALSACGRACPECVLTNTCRRARKELCAIKRAKAEAVLRGADRRGSLPMGVWSMTTLCFDDRSLPEHLHDLGVAGLYALSLHFGIEKPGYHEVGR